MSGIAMYLCSRDGLLVRVDQRALHEADHAAQAKNTSDVGALTGRVDDLEAPKARASYHQVTPAAQWTWVHNLAGYPPLTLLTDDDPQQPCFTDVTYTDANTVLIDWPEPTSGWAYI